MYQAPAKLYRRPVFALLYHIEARLVLRFINTFKDSGDFDNSPRRTGGRRGAEVSGRAVAGRPLRQGDSSPEASLGGGKTR